MVGMALLAGAVAVDRVRWFLGTFLLASFAGLLLGPRISDIDTVLFAVAFLVCAQAALVPGKPVVLAVGLAAVGGYLIGEVSIPDDGPTRDRIVTMSGSIIGANLGLLYIFGIINFLREKFTWSWVPIAFRVAAAWVGAVSILMLALGLAEVPPTEAVTSARD